MLRFVPKLLLAAGLGFVGVVVPASIAADPKETPAVVDKPADWSKFTTVADISGEVTKADDSGFTLRVTWYGPKGGTNTRPQLGRSGQQSRTRQPQMVAQHHDYDLKYAENGVVRQLKLPPKTDEKGKKVEYTIKEIADAKKPAGMPYYAAARSDLQIGSTVEVVLVRSKDVPAAKATEADLQVKYVVIHAVGSTGAKPSTDPAKKN